MSAALFDSVTRIARHEAGARAIASVGKVAEAFPADGEPADHAVTVELRDSGLVLPRVPIAVGALGLAAIPAVGDLVVVLFCEGDRNAPVVVGRLYHPGAEPPKHGDGQVVLALPPGVADADAALKLTVTPDPVFSVELPSSKVTLKLEDGKVTVAVGDDLHVVVDGSGNGQAEVAAGGSTFTMKGGGDVALSVKGTLKLEATEVDISGSAKVKISGGQVEVN